jgi:hypothetical protein
MKKFLYKNAKQKAKQILVNKMKVKAYNEFFKYFENTLGKKPYIFYDTVFLDCYSYLNNSVIYLIYQQSKKYGLDLYNVFLSVDCSYNTDNGYSLNRSLLYKRLIYDKKSVNKYILNSINSFHDLEDIYQDSFSLMWIIISLYIDSSANIMKAKHKTKKTKHKNGIKNLMLFLSQKLAIIDNKI